MNSGGDKDSPLSSQPNKESSSKKFSRRKFQDPKLNPDWLFSELQKEINKEATYNRENDTKIRAVTQGTVNYEQFRQMVLGAHLRPLDKQDKVEGCQNGRRPHVVWNTAAGKKSDAEGVGGVTTSEKAGEGGSENASQFQSNGDGIFSQPTTSGVDGAKLEN